MVVAGKKITSIIFDMYIYQLYFALATSEFGL